MVASAKPLSIFLSYSEKDHAAAGAIAKALEQIGGFEVFEPWRDVLPGENWAERISRQLKDADAMVVLITPEAMRSQQVRRDIDYALVSLQYKNRLVPVVVRQTDPDDVPWILRQLPWVPRVQTPDAIARRVAALLHGTREVRRA